MSDFYDAGRSEGIEVWRLEGSALVRQTRLEGKFFRRNAYLLLSTTARSGKSLRSNTSHLL